MMMLVLWRLLVKTHIKRFSSSRNTALISLFFICAMVLGVWHVLVVKSEGVAVLAT